MFRSPTFHNYANKTPVFLRPLVILPELWFHGSLARSHRLLFFIILFLLPILTAPLSMARSADAEESPHTYNILILNSYHQGFQWTDDIVSAVLSTMSAKLNKIEFHIEYMDSKRHYGKHFDDLLSRSLALKFQDIQPDIIITSDDSGFDFMKRHHKQIFPEIPVVFCGVNSVKSALSVDREYFTGIVETLDIVATIDMARHLLPGLSEIVIVSDGTPTGTGTRQMAIEAEPNFPDIVFTYLNGEELNTEEMLIRLQQLEKTSVAIVPAWYLDRDGNAFDNMAIYPRISKASSVPVFGTSGANLGLGIIGGKLNSGTIQGEYSAQQALRILSGESTPKDLAVETKSQNRYMFDHRQLVRFSIDKRQLPADATIVNQPSFFNERYQTETSIAAAALLLLLVIIVFLMWNIRRRQKVEQDLVTQKHIAEQYLLVAGVILLALDDKARVMLLNHKGQEVLGYKEQEVLGKDWFKLCLPSVEYDQVFAAYQGLMAGELRYFQYNENHILTKNGEKRLIAWNNVVLKDHRGSISGILSSGEDITERKQMEEVLRESEERFRTLSNASFAGIYIHDQGTILDCNNGLSKITGYNHDELIGTDAFRFIAPGWHEVVWKNVRAGYEQPYEVEGIKKDGTIYPLYIQGKNIPYKGITARVVEYRDLTEIKKEEQERINLESQLHQARKMESVGQLAGGVAHDFNNMLSAIIGHTEIAMIQCSPTGRVHPHLKRIGEAAQRSADLVRQLLAFARKQTIAPQVMDINDMSTVMLEMLHRVIGAGIDLSWLPGADLWKIKMDPSQVDQVLVNLCVNARDAITGIGKIRIETKNISFDRDDWPAISDFLPGDYVMLAVNDNGCGMSRDTQERIFEPFFTTKERGKGTGLGLATVYGIVKQNKGLINVYSEPGKGTTFRIYLPRFAGEESPVLPLVTTVGVPKGQGEAVLLVEDEAAILEVAQIMLKELGYEVFVAETPGEALTIAKTHTATIQLLITDVILPEMNGCELAQLIREITPEIKCLFTSGYSADTIAHQGVLDEDVIFLAKPFSMNDLAHKVLQALGQEPG